MQVLSKEEETKRCQDTATRLVLALSALAAHDRSGRSALEAELEEAKTKLLSLGRMVTTVTGSGWLVLRCRWPLRPSHAPKHAIRPGRRARAE